jgi:SM-20-related protein
MIRLRILLQGGHVYETRCADDAPMLAELFEAVANKGGANGLSQFRFEKDGAEVGLAIPCSQIVAIETEPPFVTPSQAETGIRPAPYIRIPEFLTEGENRAVTAYANNKEPEFRASSVEGGRKGYRQSQVLFKLDDLGIDFEAQVRALLPEVSRYFGLTLPDNFTFEMQMTTHADGGHFRIHNDNSSPATASRFLTYVYYFHRVPTAFSGGSLRLYDDSRVDPSNWVPVATFTEIKPENNMLLFFPSRHFHEVLPTLSRTGLFADGRFTVNGWIRYPQITR